MTFKVERYSIDWLDDPFDVALEMVKFQHPKIELLSYGAYAQVYGCKRLKHVYKVSRRDKAYEEFIQRIEGKSNPLFPVVHGARILRHKLEASVCVVAMEKLKPLRGKAARAFDRIFENSPLSENAWPDDLYNLISEVCSITGRVDKAAVRDAVDVLTDVHSYTGCVLDLHSDNVMLRGNQLVLTDPVC